MKRLTLFFAFILSCCAAFGAGPYNGVWTGTPLYTTGASGFGQCAEFDGSNGPISVSPDITVPGSGWTTWCWFNMGTDTGVAYLVNTAGTGNATGVYGYLGNLIFTWNGGTFTTSGTYNDSAWHFMEMGVDTSGNAYCFVDGTLLNTGTGSNTGTNQLKTIGGTFGSTPWYVDEVGYSSTTCLHTGSYTKPSAPGANNAANQDALYHLDGNVLDTNGAVLTPGDLTLTILGKTTATISTTAATNGTGPYTYQFQRSTTNGSGYVNVGTATSTRTFADTGRTPGTNYYYVCVDTDSTSPTPLTATSAQLAIKTLATNQTVIGVIGDSIQHGFTTSNPPLTSPPTEIQQILQAWGVTTGVLNNIQVVNMSVSGSATADWQTNQADYIAAVAAFQTAGVSIVLDQLGTNDWLASVTQPTWSSNQAAMLADLVNTYHYTAFVNCIPSVQASNPALVQAYNAAIPALCNGTTIRLGDQQANAIFWTNGQAFAAGADGSFFNSDAEHPSDPLGWLTLGALQAYPVAVYLGLSGRGGGRIIGGELLPTDDNSLDYEWWEDRIAA